MTKTIILPVDGSSRGENALGPAAGLADAFGAKLVLLAASEGEPLTSPSHYLASLQSRVGRVGTSVVADGGHIVPAILRALTSAYDPVLVLPSRTHVGLGAMTLGSIADEITCATDYPIVIVGLESDPAWRPHASGSLVWCFDGSIGSSAMEPLVLDWAATLDLQIHVVTVLHRRGAFIGGQDSTETRRLALAQTQRCIDAGTSAHLELLDGVNPAVAITRYAASQDANLIAASAHSHHGRPPQHRERRHAGSTPRTVSGADAPPSHARLSRRVSHVKAWVPVRER